MLPTSTTDVSRWMKAHELLHQKSKTLPSQALAKAVAFVIEDAKDRTKPTPLARIDAEMAIAVSPAILKSGRPSRAKKRQREVIAGAELAGVVKGPFRGVPFSWLLIGARAKRGSRTNTLTGGRWMIGGGVHPFKGRRVSEFKQIMADFVSRTVKGRHSSAGFFKISWNPMLVALAQFVPDRWRSHFLAVGGNGKSVSGISSAELTGGGTSNVTLTTENRLGMEGNSALQLKRNEAAHRILKPNLEAAIAANYERQVQLAIERGLIEDAAQLEANGFTVR